MLEALKNLALGQAQELGLATAARSESNKGRELLARVAAQAHHLYDAAAQVLQPGKGGKDQMYEDIAIWAARKRGLLLARTHAFHALYFNKEGAKEESGAEKALTCAAQAVEVAAKAALESKQRKERKGPLFECTAAVDREARYVQERIQRENDIVSHAKPFPGVVPPPEPQPLARPSAAWGEHAAALPLPDSARWTDEAVARFVVPGLPAAHAAAAAAAPADGDGSGGDAAEVHGGK